MITIEKALRDNFDLQGAKQVKVRDNHGLYLLVNKSGRYWRYDYKFGGKRKTLSLGAFPRVKLRGYVTKAKDYVPGAREALVAAKALIAQGIDPSSRKKEVKLKVQVEAEEKQQRTKDLRNTFTTICLEWMKLKSQGWSLTHELKVKGRLENHVLPYLGEIPVSEVTRQQISDVIITVANKGLSDTAKRLAQYTRLIMDYAFDRGLIDTVPIGNLRTLIPAKSSRPMPALTDKKDIAQLLQDIEKYEGGIVVRQALRILPYVFVRAGEFRMAEWSEFDLKKAAWVIPAAHRKIL